MQNVSELTLSNQMLSGQLRNVPVPRGRSLFFTFSLLPAAAAGGGRGGGRSASAILDRVVTTGLSRVTCLLTSNGMHSFIVNIASFL